MLQKEVIYLVVDNTGGKGTYNPSSNVMVSRTNTSSYSSDRINNPNAPISKPVKKVVDIVRAGAGGGRRIEDVETKTSISTPTPSAESVIGESTPEKRLSQTDVKRLAIVQAEKGYNLYSTYDVQSGSALFFKVKKGESPESVFSRPTYSQVESKPSMFGGTSVEPAQTISQQIRSQGTINFALNYPIEKITQAYDYIEQKRIQGKIPIVSKYIDEGQYRSYQTLPSISAVKLGATAIELYAIPQSIFASALIAQGTEDLLTRSGQERISARGTSIQSALKNYGIETNAYQGKQLSQAISIGEIALGGSLMGREIKIATQERLIKGYEKTPFLIEGTRYQAGENIFDVIRGTKNIEGTKFEVQIFQPAKILERENINLPSVFQQQIGDVVKLKEGTAITYKVNKKGVGEAVKYRTQGYVYGIEGKPELYKPRLEEPYLFSSSLVTKELPEAQLGIGRLSFKEIERAGIKTQEGILGYPSQLKFKSKSIESPNKAYLNFVGIGEQKGERIILSGGEAKILKLDEFTGNIKALGKIEELGSIKYKDVSKVEKGFSRIESGGKKSSENYFKNLYNPQQTKTISQTYINKIKSPSSTSYIPSAINKIAEQSFAKSLQPIERGFPVKIKPVSIQSAKTSSKVYVRDFESVKSIFSTKSKQKLNEGYKYKYIDAFNTKQNLETREVQKLKTQQALKYEQKQLETSVYKGLTSPRYKPVTPLFLVPPFLPSFPTGRKLKSSKKKRKGGKEDIAYAPSFTAQVLGIKNYASKSSIFKEAGRERTGAEFRGVLIAR